MDRTDFKLIELSGKGIDAQSDITEQDLNLNRPRYFDMHILGTESTQSFHGIESPITPFQVCLPNRPLLTSAKSPSQGVVVTRDYLDPSVAHSDESPSAQSSFHLETSPSQPHAPSL